ncbi:MAG TPA: S1 RNA-binding domain-containing protein [Patescibacteria group bacterium]|nr:S1 RNA-binding domain-containing protein [Patescibacteria group bacterium]
MENSIKISDNKQVNINEAGGFKKLLAETDLVKIPKVGDILLGKVIDVSRGEIRIDIEGLTTGVIRGRELLEAGEDYADLKIGDSVEATVIDLENENGEMELSFRFAGQQKAWHDLNELKTEGKIVKALITDANKGGLMIKVGKVAGFLPVSQLMPEHYPRVPGGDKNRILDRLKSYIGQEFEVKVIDATEAEDKLIVSEKAAWEEKQKDVIASYKVGDMIEGVITAVTDFGVFVEFGSDRLEGLVHISELAWQRIDNPNDLVKVGDKIQAAIINVEGSKIFLSMKKLKEDPWKNALTKYQVGQSVSGKVLKVNPFGLFVELDPEIHGLAHVSELSAKASVNPMEIAKPGDVLSFKILSIEPSAHRLGLSLKISQVKPQTNPEPEPAAPSAEPTLAPAEPAEPAAN